MNTASLKILFILALFLYPFLGFTQWLQLDADIDNKTLNKVYALNEDTAFIVGDSIILKTVNGGESWDIQTPPYILETILFVDNNVGYIAGHNVVLKTEDSGENWFCVTPTDPMLFFTMHFVNPDSGYVTQGWPIFRTFDGGETWYESSFCDSLYYNHCTSISSISFLTNNIGYAVGSRVGFAGTQACVLKTIDGGNTWFTPQYFLDSDIINTSTFLVLIPYFLLIV